VIGGFGALATSILVVVIPTVQSTKLSSVVVWEVIIIEVVVSPIVVLVRRYTEIVAGFIST